jgi:predicted nicotinamide N-methyase
MWSAAVILSRMLCRNPQLVSGKRVLEVGAGLGLCGIVAARWASEITLSDYNPTILRHMDANILINKQEHGEVTVEAAPIRPGTTMRVRFLDWEQLGGPEEEQPSEMKVVVESDLVEGPAIQALAMAERFETIIASDMVCQRKDAFGVVRTLLAFLAPGGTAHIVLPSPSNRYGVEAFPEALEAAGLKFTCEPVEEEALTRGIEEASYFRWNYFVVHR